MPTDMTPERFEEIVSEALDEVPGEFLNLLDNVVFLVEEEPPEGQGEMLGVYEGVPLTERWSDWGPPRMPDRIVVFRGPTLRMCAGEDEVRDEVAVTVVHEIAHHFGIAEERLHELGWG